LSFRRR
jgi:hypothetical protein